MKTRRAPTQPSAPPGDDTCTDERLAGPRWLKPVEIKLHPPTPPAAHVERTAVRDRLCACRSAKLILVRAPAGYGKTTLMAQIKARLRSGGIDTAWLTIDRADNDVSRFLQCLEQAVAAMDGETLPASGRDAVETLVATRTPFTLFLDEFELLHEPAALGLVHEILERLPRQGQLVIGTRNLPDLGLARLRARGDLVEVDAEELRFTLPEARQYFTLRGKDGLPADVFLQLHQKTEGWIAALWMASLALDRHEDESAFIQRFSGSTRAIGDYLADEVYAKQDAGVREFLLRTSLLRNFDASLCQALVPGADCARMLERLYLSGQFLAPLEGEDGTYRYHSLFAEFLRTQLQRERAHELGALHHAACAWYESNGRPVPAIDHALEGGDLAHALLLLGRHAEDLLKDGRMRLLARWFNAIPAAQLRAHPRLEAVAIWATCFTRGPQTTLARLNDASGFACDDPHVQASVNALRPLLLAMLDRHDEAFEAGHFCLRHVPTGNAFADSVLSNAMAFVVSVIGSPQDAYRLLDSARRTQGDGMFNRMYTESLQGILELTEGRLRQAMARFRMAVGSTRASSYSLQNGNAWAGILYADGLYEANELEQAERLLNTYLPLARDVALPDHMVIGYAMRSRLAFLQGDIDTALRALVELEWAGNSRQQPRVVAAAKLERSRLFLMQGQGTAARDELERARDPAVWDKVRSRRFPAHELGDHAMGCLRWEICFGDARAALPDLAQELARATAESRHRRVLKLRVLYSLALERAGDGDTALGLMGTVLQEASREGFVRLIADEGEGAGRLVHRYMHGPGARALAHEPLFSDYLQRLMAAIGPIEAVDAHAAPAVEMVTDLTRKERRVLELLAAGYSNNAIVEKLFVSDSTVRTHLRNIYSKLKAKNRTHAVALARKLALVP
jgi:LuxR family maltose regulon positive regulatory protein